MILKPIRGNAVHLRHNIYILINYHEKQIGNIAFYFWLYADLRRQKL